MGSLTGGRLEMKRILENCDCTDLMAANSERSSLTCALCPPRCLLASGFMAFSMSSSAFLAREAEWGMSNSAMAYLCKHSMSTLAHPCLWFRNSQALIPSKDWPTLALNPNVLKGPLKTRLCNAPQPNEDRLIAGASLQCSATWQVEITLWLPSAALAMKSRSRQPCLLSSVWRVCSSRHSCVRLPMNKVTCKATRAHLSEPFLQSR